jgi:hypothetical protein
MSDQKTTHPANRTVLSSVHAHVDTSRATPLPRAMSIPTTILVAREGDATPKPLTEVRHDACACGGSDDEPAPMLPTQSGVSVRPEALDNAREVLDAAEKIRSKKSGWSNDAAAYVRAHVKAQNRGSK